MKSTVFFCLVYLRTSFNSSGQKNEGLEDRVVSYFRGQISSDSLTTIVKGYVVKLNPLKHKVYIDTTLIASSDLGFFEDKYPEFIAPLLSENVFVDSSLLGNKSVSLNDFNNARAADFLKDKTNYKEGSISITISEAFYFKGAYYVHAWLINHDKNYFHHKRCTFKFDENKSLLGKSCENHYQTSYSGATKYLNSINTAMVGD